MLDAPNLLFLALDGLQQLRMFRYSRDQCAAKKYLKNQGN